MEYLGAGGTLIHEKNLKSKISCQTPFKEGPETHFKIKGSDQRETGGGGGGKVANDIYWSGTVVIDVLFSLLMNMQTGSTNNHISQIFIVFAAPVYLWDCLALIAAPVLTARYKGDCHVSNSSTSPNTVDRPMTNNWAGVSGT
jgi:hypothetical protein